MATVHGFAKAIVHTAINMEYVTECGYKMVADVYHAEYGNFRGLSSAACKDYLQGLPSLCSVPFENYKILDLMKDEGIERKTEDGKYSLIEQYWAACGYHLYQLIIRELIHCTPFKKK